MPQVASLDFTGQKRISKYEQIADIAKYFRVISQYE